MLDAITEALTIRITPAAKTALRTAAARDHRSLNNMVGVMIRKEHEGQEERIFCFVLFVSFEVSQDSLCQETRSSSTANSTARSA